MLKKVPEPVSRSESHQISPVVLEIISFQQLPLCSSQCFCFTKVMGKPDRIENTLPHRLN